VAGADVVVLATEWPEFVGLDPKALAAIARGRTVIDARNALDPVTWRAAGWRHRGLGRSSDVVARKAA
jgi:UDPglucose 6-dehydrogenase